MPVNIPRRMPDRPSSGVVRAAIGATLAAASAAEAGTGCLAYRFGSHDFDQSRMAAPGIVGLPGNGGSHCYPTTWTSWFAYLNQHGFPLAMMTGAPLDWTDPALYNQVSTVISTVGNFCGTTPGNGTSNGDGLDTYLALFGLGDAFHFVKYGIDWSQSPPTYHPYITPNWIAYHIENGGLPGINISWSSFDGAVYQKTGAHVVGVPATVGACSEIELLMRDPATGGSSSTTQSAYDFTESPSHLITGLHHRGNNPNVLKTLWHLDAWTEGTAFLTGVRVLYPNSASILPPALTEVHVFFPFQLDDDPRPPLSGFHLPPGLLGTAVAPHPSGIGSLVLAQDGDGMGSLWWHDPVGDLELAEYPDVRPNPGPMAIDRFGGVWLLGDGSVRRLSLFCAEAMCWDELVDRPVGFDVQALAFSNSDDLVFALGADESGHAVLGALAMTGDGSVAPTPLPELGDLEGPFHLTMTDGGRGFWVSTRSTDKLFLYAHGPSAGQDPGVPVFRRAVVLPGIAAPQWIEETDAGRLLVVQDDTVHEFSYDPDADAWASSDKSGFDGMTGVAALNVTRSRSDELRGVAPEEHPDLPHLDPAEVALPCPADVNFDHVVDFSDLLVVLSSWGPCALACPGDVQQDNDVDFDDLLAVLSAFGDC